MDVLRGVGGCELAGEVGEVGEGELARVGALADAEEDDVGVDEVVDCEEGRGGFDGGLGFGGAGEFAEDLTELLLDFVEGGGVGLGKGVSVLSFVWKRRLGTNLCFVVDGGAKHEAWETVMLAFLVVRWICSCDIPSSLDICVERIILVCGCVVCLL